MRPSTRLSARVLATTALVGAGVALATLPASAHVEIEQGEFVAGGEAVLTLSVPHGCDDSPTVRIRIQLPESVPNVIPTVNPGWELALVTEQLATPLDLGEGRTLTERVTEVDFTARTPLPPEFRDVFHLALEIPEDAAGSTLAFPTIQECATGSTEWTQIPTETQDPAELEYPAPSISVLAAVDAQDGGTVPTTQLPAPASAESEADDDGATNGLAIAGLTAGIVGMALGGGALAASKRPGAGTTSGS